MGGFKRDSIKVGCLWLFLVVLAVGGCAHQAIRTPSSGLDTPAHHVFNGFKSLDIGRLEDARREFELALELDPKYSPAYRGRGFVLGFKKEFGAAFEAMALAKKHVRSGEEEATCHVGFMRLFTLRRQKDWLKDVKRHYENALRAVGVMPSAHYYMGMAYKDAYRFNDAGHEFIRVMDLNGPFVNEADEQLKIVHKIQRALPGSGVGKRLALRDKITRADASAIFVHELRLERTFLKAGRPAQVIKNIPSDIDGHPLRYDIVAVTSLGLGGLEVLADGCFMPDEPISRAAYAMVIEDIIGTITHDKKLYVRQIGSASPFPDVRPDAPYYNAVMVCTTRGIMSAADFHSGAFEPEGPISGADALLIIRKLREKLKIF